MFGYPIISINSKTQTYITIDKEYISREDDCGELEETIHHWNVLSLEMDQSRAQLNVVKEQQKELKGQLE